jgi:hypothetical protein
MISSRNYDLIAGFMQCGGEDKKEAMVETRPDNFSHILVAGGSFLSFPEVFKVVLPAWRVRREAPARMAPCNAISGIIFFISWRQGESRQRRIAPGRVSPWF